METFSALLALCEGNSPDTGEFPPQRPVTRSFHIFFYLRLDKRLSKQPRRRWFETPSCSFWRHCNVLVLLSGESCRLVCCSVYKLAIPSFVVVVFLINVNSLRSSESIRRQTYWPTFVQVVACQVLRHYWSETTLILRTHLSEIQIKIQTFPFNGIHLKMTSAESRPLCSYFNINQTEISRWSQGRFLLHYVNLKRSVSLRGDMWHNSTLIDGIK